MKTTYTLLLLSFLFFAGPAQSQDTTAPALSAIKEADLKRDLFVLASDEMRGKRAGTIDELRAAAWLAEQASRAGLEPAGEDGTFFQLFPLHRATISERSKISINNNPLKLWSEAWVRRPQEAQVNGEVVWLNSLADTTANLQGKIIAMDLLPPDKLPEEWISLYVYRYAHSAIRQQTNRLKGTGAAAIVLVADSIAESEIGFFGHGLKEGTYNIEKSENGNANAAPPVILVSSSRGEELKQPNAQLSADLSVDRYIHPSVNVVAKAPGNDPELRDEYVLYSGHHDHDGIGVPVAGDSIWNGADDNATVNVAMLAIGRAFVKNPAKRSALFVWHGAEERGLFGSRYFVQHPTVEKEAIVAVLNGDMIGRNEPGTAALLGSIPPHRNSEELVQAAMDANEEITRFNIDTSWDEASHPENWYFRSDHLPYAQADIPAIFFTTLLHPDYHTPEDEAEKIDLEKLTKMTRWMYTTGWKIANIEKAPALDKE